MSSTRNQVHTREISAARLRLRKHPAMIPAMPLVGTRAETSSDEQLLRSVALEAQIERLQSKVDHLETQISHFRATGAWPAEAAASSEAESTPQDDSPSVTFVPQVEQPTAATEASEELPAEPA